MKTIGDFYLQRILTRKKLIHRELPGDFQKGRIEKDLFGWNLYSGNHCINCRSEEEARYLKVFVDTNVSEVKVPGDDEDLREILPELEKIVSRI